MKKYIVIGILIIFALFVGGGVVAYNVFFKITNAPTKQTEEETDESIPENTSIEVSVKPSSKPNTIDLIIKKLEKNYTGISYDVMYETKGTFQGVNSGTKPIDVTDKEELVKEVYLGTCSKNVCVPHTGVTSVTVELELIDTKGKKSRYTNDFSL